MAFRSSSHLHIPLGMVKLVLITLLLLLPTVFLTVKLLVPFAVSSLPSVRTRLRTFLAPPYLFLTINFIILTIWKLSEKTPKEPTTHLPPLKPKPPTHHPKVKQEHDPIPREEPVTRPDENPIVPVVHCEEKKTIDPPPPSAVTVEDDKESEEEEEEVLSMDATWRKITRVAPEMKRSETFTERRRQVDETPVAEMRKSETFREARRLAAGGAELLLLGQDELNQRCEAFINNFNSRMRLPPPVLHRETKFQ